MGNKEEDSPCLRVVYATLLSSLDSMGEEYATSSPPLLIVCLGLSFPFLLEYFYFNLPLLEDLDASRLVVGDMRVPQYVICSHNF